MGKFMDTVTVQGKPRLSLLKLGLSALPSLCHFVTQGLLPPVAVLGSASPCPCVAL